MAITNFMMCPIEPHFAVSSAPVTSYSYIKERERNRNADKITFVSIFTYILQQSYTNSSQHTIDVPKDTLLRKDG